MRRHAKGTRGEARNVCKGCRWVKDVEMYEHVEMYEQRTSPVNLVTPWCSLIFTPPNCSMDEPDRSSQTFEDRQSTSSAIRQEYVLARSEACLPQPVDAACARLHGCACR